MKPGIATDDAAVPARPAHWAELGEHTFVAGIRILFWIYRVLGRLPFRICLYPVVAWYWATRRGARAASRQYQQRLRAAQGDARSVGARDTLRHFLAFADTILDKLLAVSGRRPAGGWRVEGEDELLALVAQGRGAVIVTGHVGCMELCRISAERHRTVRLNVLVHTAHAAQFTRLLQRLQPDSSVCFIQVADVSPATAMLLADKLAQGEFIAIAGDRVPVGLGLTVPARFLGHEARWPAGAYVLAALLKCPLYAMACVREPDGYVLRVQRLAEQVVLPRGAREQAMAVQAQQFADWLQAVLQAAPLAWFNFFDFWGQGRGAAAATRPPQDPT